MTSSSHAASDKPPHIASATVLPSPHDMDELEYEALPTTSVKVQLLAGAIAGIAEHTIIYPIDAIKTRMQVMRPTPAAVYTGITHAVSRIASTEGALTMWRGMTSVVLGAGPAHAVYFSTYEVVKQRLGGNFQGHHPVATASAGACAAVTSEAFMNPFDVIKQRMQIHGSPFRSVFKCAASVFQTEGLRAFYISYPTTLMMSVPFNGIQFAAYDSLSKILNPQRKHDPFIHCISGGLAGGIAAAATNPLDVAKTLLQTRGTSLDPAIRNCNGLPEALRLIYERDGLAGFTRGIRPRVVQMFPSTAICWTVYEFFKHFLYRNGTL